MKRWIAAAGSAAAVVLLSVGGPAHAETNPTDSTVVAVPGVCHGVACSIDPAGPTSDTTVSNTPEQPIDNGGDPAKWNNDPPKCFELECGYRPTTTLVQLVPPIRERVPGGEPSKPRTPSKPQGHLPVTGSSTPLVLAFGGLTLGTGTFITIATRRRRLA